MFFLAVMVSVPLFQQTHEALDGNTPQAFSIFSAVPKAADAFADEPGSLPDRVFAANGVLLRSMQTYETELEDRSFLARAFIPPMQAFTARWLGLGNEQAYLGRGEWLFYRPGVDYLTGPPFLDPSVLKQRALAGDATVGSAVRPDPLPAVLDFHRQLQARGIQLLLMPVPVKGVIEPSHLSRRYSPDRQVPVQNPSSETFRRSLEAEGIHVLDVSEDLLENRTRSGSPQFLRMDTHWTPEAMEVSASRLATRIRDLVPLPHKQPPELRRTQETVSGEGDVAAMLKLPEDSPLYPPQTVKIHPVLQADGSPWAPDPDSPVLLLGDSFSNIYSLDAMGWGASAGFAEQLSYALGYSVDTIRRNDAGAFATRELLVRDLAQGTDRLSGKQVVVWQFAVRELAVGDWKLLELPEPRPTPPANDAGGFFVPPPGMTVEAEGVVRSRSAVPRPGTVPYKDQVFAVHLTDLRGEKVPDGSQAVVYLSGMVENRLTAPSAWKVGQRVRIALRDWNDVAGTYERLNRSELDDFELQLEPPCWGTPVNP